VLPRDDQDASVSTHSIFRIAVAQRARELQAGSQRVSRPDYSSRRVTSIRAEFCWIELRHKKYPHVAREASGSIAVCLSKSGGRDLQSTWVDAPETHAPQDACAAVLSSKMIHVKNDQV
jgi:hypothetical protein